MTFADTAAPALPAPPSSLGRPPGGARNGALMAVASMLCVQLGLGVSVPLLDRLGPVGTVWLRLVWAALLLLVLVRPRRSDFMRKDLVACAVLGVATAGLMVLFMCAVTRIPLGTASALEFLGPLGLALYGAAGGRRLWALLAGAGVVLLTEPWHGGTDLVGVGFALAAALCWAVYIAFTQKVGDQVTGLKGLALSMPVAAIVTTFFAAPTEVGHVTWPLVLIGLALALLHPVLPFSLEFLALRRLTTTAFGTLMSLEPAIAVAVGLVILGQVPGPASAFGVAFVVVAGVGATRAGARSDLAKGENRENAGDAVIM
ncbi:EamA family transporter [Streptomyces sp. H39-S7]|uniref:EamA family transporter n=1 Tax=Streptomyces sp. H39-S7 TaxID=3004357 RepID=UPI0022AE7454|nr:EamA family transporter [Streptomyces sp. H39-S7]MCZ4121915.1 EamA family transporter [Streptomyces sp. H39-S7]